ncbi:hypothetical protein F4777DRAFT_601646 [Nemania sp. FL0916]|nr:hypothetical protein F4777DRAFT_601646 [Nemania sp. FL0916]
MPKDATARNGFLPRKRHTSLSSLFSKILPSNRAEHGGTARAQDLTGESDSAYIDLGLNPNDLTGWNLAQDRPPGTHSCEPKPRIQHRRSQSWSLQRERPPLHHGGNQSPRKIHQPTLSLDIPRAPHSEPATRELRRKLQPMTNEEIRRMLKTKEDSRRHRRNLKESGDWLGVQGADPYSGEFAVLTPTSSLSSETTTNSTKKRLVELARRQKTAKIAYEQAMLDEEAEKEKILLRKGQSKLKKIEHVKETLRKKQQRFPAWSQHRRHWSSAFEPGLSPIPQSLKSYRLEDKSDEAMDTSIRNFSRPIKVNGGSVAEGSKLVEPAGEIETADPSKGDPCSSCSTDTIMRMNLQNSELSNMSKAKTTTRCHTVSSESDGPASQEQKSEKNFLWRRRRRITGPREAAKVPKPLMAHFPAERTEENLALSSVEPIPPMPLPLLPSRQKSRDHFLNLLIPDYHLNVVHCPEQTVMLEKSKTPTEDEPSPMVSKEPTESSHRKAQSKPPLRTATNLSDCREAQTKSRFIVLDNEQATATLSRSKSKGNTKPPPVCRRVIPLRSTSFQARRLEAQWPQTKTQTVGQVQNIDEVISRGASELEKLRQHPTNQAGPKQKTPLNPYIDLNVKKPQERLARESASIPTITITGSDPRPHLLSEDIQSGTETQKTVEDNVIEKTVVGGNVVGKNMTNGDGTPPIPSDRSSKEVLCDGSTTDGGLDQTMSSHLATPQRKLQNSVPAHKIPEIDTTSTNSVMIGTGSMLTVKSIQPRNPYENPKIIPTRHFRLTPERAVIVTAPPQCHKTIQGSTTEAREITGTGTGPQNRRQNSKVRLSDPHQHQMPSGHEETMIQEAARIAMQRSRAKEVVTRRTRTSSCTPSPRTQGVREDTTLAIPTMNPTSLSLVRNTGGGVDVGLTPSVKGGDGGALLRVSQTQLREQEQGCKTLKRTLERVHDGREMEEGHGRDGNMAGAVLEIKDREKGVECTARENAKASNNKNSDNVFLSLVSVLIMACIVWFGLACAWWVVVKPAFYDLFRSLLWTRGRGNRRRRRGESERTWMSMYTWRDVVVFAGATVFLGLTVVVFVGGVRAGVGVVSMLGVW